MVQPDREAFAPFLPPEGEGVMSETEEEKELLARMKLLLHWSKKRAKVHALRKRSALA
ncbi:hypothetical protein JCM15831A_14870 [Asaia astilbis]